MLTSHGRDDPAAWGARAAPRGAEPPRSAPKRLAVAAAQFAPVHGNVQANLGRISRLLHEAVARGADLVVFPELATTGYSWSSTEAIAPYAEPVPGPTTNWLARQCRELGSHVVLGLAERGGPPTGQAARRPLFNTAVLVGPGGLVGRYRKTKLWSWDTLWATAGASPPSAWPTPLGRVGALICADLDYPEGTSWLAGAGADLIAVPTCWSDEPTPSPVWRARARENGLPFAVANVSGTEWEVTFSAGSCVIDEVGRVLDQVHATEALAVATIDLAAGRVGRRRRAAELARAASDAYEALDRNAQLFSPTLSLPTLPRAADQPRARAWPTSPVQIAVVQGSTDSDAENDLAALASRLADLGKAGEPPTLAVFPTFLAPGLANDGGLLSRLALACRDYGPTEIVLSVLDVRTGHTSVALAAAGTIVTSYRVDAVGLRSGSGAPFRPVMRAWGAVGLLTAAELLRPEPARCLAINGSEIIAATGRLGRPPVEAAPSNAAAAPPLDLWRVRAGENNCYLAVANATLPDGGGMSAIHGPAYYDNAAARVTMTASEAGGASLRLTLDPATRSGRMVADKPLLAQRRPDLYASDYQAGYEHGG